jgi:hypothetical protein
MREFRNSKLEIRNKFETRNSNYQTSVVAGIIAICVSVCLGAGQGPATRPAENEPAATQSAATRGAATRPVGLLEPVKEGTTQPATQPTAQFADGRLLSDLVGELSHEKNGEAVFVFEYGGKRLRMGVLRNSFLERMEEAAAADPSVRFRVTGRATSYRGLNHILIEDAAIISDGK